MVTMNRLPVAIAFAISLISLQAYSFHLNPGHYEHRSVSNNQRRRRSPSRLPFVETRAAATVQQEEGGVVSPSNAWDNNLSSMSSDNSDSSITIGSTTIDFPWTEAQESALRDQMSRFTIEVPFGKNSNNESNQRYVLWRNLVKSTPELDGYPISFLADRLQLMTGDQSASTVIPYLDDFRFEPTGGLSGNVYGVSGVADGTRIQTTPVGNVEETIPQSYVLTGCVVYELGSPLSEATPSSLPSVKNDDTTLLAGVLDPDLVNLAGLTATALTGAWALETLSHHLTVNVFWI